MCLKMLLSSNSITVQPGCMQAYKVRWRIYAATPAVCGGPYSVVIALPCSLAACKRTQYTDESMLLRLPFVQGLTFVVLFVSGLVATWYLLKCMYLLACTFSLCVNLLWRGVWTKVYMILCLYIKFSDSILILCVCFFFSLPWGFVEQLFIAMLSINMTNCCLFFNSFIIFFIQVVLVISC